MKRYVLDSSLFIAAARDRVKTRPRDHAELSRMEAVRCGPPRTDSNKEGLARRRGPFISEWLVADCHLMQGTWFHNNHGEIQGLYAYLLGRASSVCGALADSVAGVPVIAEQSHLQSYRKS